MLQNDKLKSGDVPDVAFTGMGLDNRSYSGLQNYRPFFHFLHT